MIIVERLAQYASWVRSLNNARAKAKISLRVDRLALGNPGDVKPVGDGVSEMRIDYGPGCMGGAAGRGWTVGSGRRSMVSLPV